MSGKRKQGRKHISGTIHGQSKPLDTATGILWEDVNHFSEVFNKFVFKKDIVKPDELKDANTVEEVILRVRGTDQITLKSTRDAAKIKTLNDGRVLMILGLENQTEINYQMPFRVMTLDFINYARQVAMVEQRNAADFKNQISRPENSGEYLGKFRKADRIKPVITLVIYYGERPWDGPKSLYDMFEDCEGKEAARNYEMYLLDVRHMSVEELNSFSPALKAFFGFLKYENTLELLSFIHENEASFENLPMTTLDALIEITHSRELGQYKKDYAKNGKGEINMSKGIQIYGQQQKQEGKNEGRNEGMKLGIDDTNKRVATDMLRENLPLQLIEKISRLSEDTIRNIAKNIGVAIP